MRLYQNGALVAEQFITLRPFRDLEPTLHPGIGIGATQDGGGQRFDGLVDELSLYNRALTAAEIQGIFDAGNDGKIRMVVAKTNPDLGTTVTTAPTTFVVDFSYAYDPDSVQASDFTVNGIAANSVQLTDNDTATFTFATSPVTGEGVQSMHMDTGAVTRLGDDLALAVYDGIFSYDITTKFYVVDDSSANRTFEYIGSGTATESYSLSNSSPRGAASTAAGDKVWVVDANRQIYVYNPSGGILGSWTAGSMNGSAQLEGITTNGTDIWIVDAKQDKVFRYANAASRLTGSQNAASNFSLNNGNKNPMDLVTDGTSIWVIEDASTDKVFRYTLSGSLLGSWTITSGGGLPTGITLDPSNAQQHLWIVDNATDRVYQFDNARSRTSGSQSAGTIFNLAAGNTNPQGIADPPTLSIGDAVAVEGGSDYRFTDAFVTADAYGLAAGRAILVGPDGNLYVASHDTDVVKVFEGGTGRFLRDLTTAGGELDGPWGMAFGPDGRLYVGGRYSNNIIRFDVVNGSYNVFVAAGSGGLGSPHIALAFGPDGNLYACNRVDTNTALGSVKRFAGATGEYLGDFVPAGSGGLNLAGGIDFGPDGNLYVTSFATREIKRYDGQTGAFIDTFISAGSGGSVAPGRIKFHTDGRLYVSDRDISKVHRYSAISGTFLDSLTCPTEFSNGDIAFSPSGELYVSLGTPTGQPFSSVGRFAASNMAAFNVSLSEASATPVGVDFATAPGTALAGSDYAAATGSIDFAPGETTRTVLVRTLDDALPESSETFLVNLTNSIGATITDAQAVGTITDNEPATPQVGSTTINGGAVQRSRVTSLSITFNAQVTFAGPVANAFTLTRNSGGSVSFSASANVINGVTVVTLNNFTGGETQSGSLRDGRYTLTALASQISANGQQMASNYTFGDAQGLFRFYGDLNGDRRVDISDFGFFSLAYLQVPNYNGALDFNNDGRIDIADFGQFSVRFFTTLP